MVDNDSRSQWIQTEHAAIVNLLSAYCHALDERRFEDMAKLFTRDALVMTRFAGSVHRGPAQICDYLRSQPKNMRGLHLTMNPEIDASGSDVSVRSDFVVIAPRTSESVVVAWGWYRDVLSREHDQWKFQERHIETQWRMSDESTPLDETGDGITDESKRAAKENQRFHLARSNERLFDELEIRNLVARIAHLADMSETLDDYLACFSEDAVWEFGGSEHEGISPTRVEGRDALRNDRLARRARAVQGPGTPNRHVITTLAVEVGDDDTARADSYFLLLTDTTASPRIRNTGHYLDKFVRTSEGWKLPTRKITTG
jgi:3-phenylpropionate/cinnamic acid dioxygenase small subunit